MSVHLRLELTENAEIREWEQVKSYLGTKSNTDALRVLIRRMAQESENPINGNSSLGVST